LTAPETTDSGVFAFRLSEPVKECDRTQRSKIPYHLVGAAERRKWDYRYIPDLDRIQDAAAEPAKKEE
jgi:hypothetical protein